MGGAATTATKGLRDRFELVGRAEIEDGVTNVEGGKGCCCSACCAMCCSIDLWLDRVTLRENGGMELLVAFEVMLLATAGEEG